MRHRKSLVPTVLALTVLALLAAAAPAAASVSGSVSFHCTAKLPAYPTPEGYGICEGDTTPAVADVNLSGLDTSSVPYAVAGQGAFGAAFTYTQACIANEPPLVGTARGTATVVDAPAVYGGTPTRADVEAQFRWSRVGIQATVVVTGWQIRFSNGRTATGTNGAGEAVFIPVSGTNHLCPGTGETVKALVLGEVTAVA